MLVEDVHFNLFTIINTGENLDHFIIIQWSYFNIKKSGAHFWLMRFWVRIQFRNTRLSVLPMSGSV